MDKLTSMFDSQFVYALGWTIVHSFWQCLLVLVLLSLSLLLNKRSRPETRYWLSMAALICCVLASIQTFIYCYQDIAQATMLLEHMQTSMTSAQSQTWWIATFQTINPWLDTIVLFWCAGLTIQTLRYVADIVLTQRLKHRSTMPLPSEWVERLQVLAQKLDISREVQFLQSAKIAIPLVIGHFKPVVLLPLGMLTQLPQAQIEAIILHELAHIKRHDYLVNILQCLVKVMFFFNPFVLAISKKVDIERENACDDIAVQTCGDPIVFTHSLSQFADISARSQTAMTASSDKYLLLDRVKRLFSKQDNLSNTTERLIALFCVGLLSLTLNVNASHQPTQIQNSVGQNLIDEVKQDTRIGEVPANDVSPEVITQHRENLTPNAPSLVAASRVSADEKIQSSGYMNASSSEENTENTVLLSAVSTPTIDYLKQEKLQPTTEGEQPKKRVNQSAAEDIASFSIGSSAQNKASIYSAISNRTFKHFTFKPERVRNKEYVIFPPFKTKGMSIISRDKKWKYQSQRYLSQLGKAPAVFFPLEKTQKIKTTLSKTDANKSLIAQVNISKVLFELTHRKYFTGFDRTPVTHEALVNIGALNDGSELPSADNLNVDGYVISNRPNPKTGIVLGVEFELILSAAKNGEQVGRSTQKVYFQSNRLDQEKFKQIKKGFENSWALIGPPVSIIGNKTKSKTNNQWEALIYRIQEQIRDTLIEARDKATSPEYSVNTI